MSYIFLIYLIFFFTNRDTFKRQKRKFFSSQALILCLERIYASTSLHSNGFDGKKNEK